MGLLRRDDKMVARDGLANRGCTPLTQMRGKTRYRQSFWCFLKSSGRLDKAQACCNGCPLQSEEHLSNGHSRTYLNTSSLGYHHS